MSKPPLRDRMDYLATTSRDSPWSGSPDWALVVRLERLLQRIPPEWAIPVHLYVLRGVPQTVIARRVGVGQPAVWHRIQHGLKRMAWVSSALPDLVPEEVHRHLLEAGEPEHICDVAADYWSNHKIPRHGGRHPQPTAWSWLHERSRGLVVRRRGEPGTVGDIVTGIEAIRALRGYTRVGRTV